MAVSLWIDGFSQEGGPLGGLDESNPLVSAILSNPIIQQGMQNPRVLAAFRVRPHPLLV
jgi:hypothetical protein